MSIFKIMKKEISKKKLGFKKKFVANLGEHEAADIQGGKWNTNSDIPCQCTGTCSCVATCPISTDGTLRWCDVYPE